MNWQGKKVLITGASGFLGTWLSLYLNKIGAEPVGLWHDPTYPRKMEMMGWVHADLRDFDDIHRIIAEVKPDIVFHLGAQALHGVGMRAPLYTIQTNVMGTTNVLEACRQIGGVGAIVVSTSDKAYGEQPKLPYTELASMNGKAPYEVSKSCADLISQGYRKTFVMPISVIRCGNIFGGGDYNFSRLIPYTIRQCLRNETIVLRSDGTLLRDYVYVEDVVDAFLKVAESVHDIRNSDNEDFNVSYNKPQTVEQVVVGITDLMDCSDIEIKTQTDPSRFSAEIPEQWLDSTKIQKKLGWQPIIGYDEGMQRTIGWYNKYVGGSK
jgi:CDP-glucose 4,6-dehydratase